MTAYSNGEPFTRFYHNDTQGHFTVERAPVGRDGQGRITDLWHQGHHVHFELGADGHVAGVTGTSDVSGSGACCRAETRGVSESVRRRRVGSPDGHAARRCTCC
ncbi:MAG: hypothetical protein IPO58_24725, partial [Betaproteobacteria bacterium]|nr:hypothetical protein [Betaproteobacteria bacterium]